MANAPFVYRRSRLATAGLVGAPSVGIGRVWDTSTPLRNAASGRSQRRDRPQKVIGALRQTTVRLTR